MNRSILTTVAAAMLAVSAGSAAAGAEHVVGQKSKKFTVDSLDVALGDVVKFENQDPFFHNVFSLSDAATFDLGSYPEGESKAVTFDTAGAIEVECAIHPGMRMIINVK